MVVFIDFSASIRGAGRAAYRREIETSILPWLAAGDRIMIAPIHDKTLTGFRPLAEASLPALPRFNGFVDNALKHAQRVKATESRIADARQQVRGEVAQAFATPLASRYAHVLLHWPPSKSCRTR